MLCTVCCVLSTVCCVLCTVYCVPCTMYCVLCVMCCVFVCASQFYAWSCSTPCLPPLSASVPLEGLCIYLAVSTGRNSTPHAPGLTLQVTLLAPISISSHFTGTQLLFVLQTPFQPAVLEGSRGVSWTVENLID